MGLTNDGFKVISKLIGNLGSDYPSYLAFAGDSADFIGTETSFSNEYLRKTITWNLSGTNALFTVQLGANEAIGSQIDTTGLVTDATLYTGSLVSYDESFIGLKAATFNTQIEGEIIFRRPQ